MPRFGPRPGPRPGPRFGPRRGSGFGPGRFHRRPGPWVPYPWYQSGWYQPIVQWYDPYAWMGAIESEFPSDLELAAAVDEALTGR
jgi:hypothetical protein